MAAAAASLELSNPVGRKYLRYSISLYKQSAIFEIPESCCCVAPYAAAAAAAEVDEVRYGIEFDEEEEDEGEDEFAGLLPCVEA